MSLNIRPGTRVSHYRVISALGAGGMGEVYLAEDANLSRRVALKVLPDSFIADGERMRRFRQEARAASALNHPNIITIHEIGEAEGRQFIATEYVEGETLRTRMTRSRLGVGEALDIAVQIAQALEAAHAAGVVHRDIKPENVMLRADGYAKVLDFGLAKLTEGRAPAADTEAPTRFKVRTAPGLVLGTISYMSPEQARGQETDARTDIWSLGVVLYEMLAGRAPFDGETPSDVLVSILSHEPAPLAGRAPEDAPAELQGVVEKALRKERRERYGTAREMLGALREMQADVVFRERQKRNSDPAVESLRAETATAAQSPANQGRKGMLLWAALALVAASALALGVYEYVRGRHAAPPAAAKMKRLTANGKVTEVALSPDGKYTAYVAGNTRQQSLWVMQAATGGQSQLVPPAEETLFFGLTFSNDGDYVYYLRVVKFNPSELYRVPTVGGTPKRLLTYVDSAVTFSPDGRQLAFVRYVNEDESRLMVANADGSGERALAARKSPNFFVSAGVVKISWSPDGETIVCPSYNTELAFGSAAGLVGVSARDGTERPVSPQKWVDVAQVAWLRDGGLVVVAKDKLSSPAQVWHLSYPDGEARKITDDFNDYSDISVTADSGTIATVQSEQISNIWVAPEGDAAHARRLTDSRLDGLQGLAWTPDGRLVYSSDEGGNPDIWIVDGDGGNRRRLTENPGWDGWPSVSPDGRYVVYTSDRGGVPHIWRMDVDGGNPVQLTRGNGENNPNCSPDGRWVYYTPISTGGISNGGPVWRVPLGGGDSAPFIKTPVGFPTVSPDNKLIGYYYIDLQASPPWGIAVAPVEGGSSVERLEIPASTWWSWTPDGRGIAYVDDRYLNVWVMPLGGGRPTQLTDFKTDQTFNFAWSPDGKQLALARGNTTSDIVLITDFR